MASVDIISFENKYDYPDNYELQQHRRSSVAVEWYKKCITTASSTVLLFRRRPGPPNVEGARSSYAGSVCFSLTRKRTMFVYYSSLLLIFRLP